jgi:hypothetical protein
VSIGTLDPRTDTRPLWSTGPLAPRPATLQGQRLGLVCNGLFDCEMLFDHLGTVLEEREGTTVGIKVVKASVSVPPTPDQWLAMTDQATVAVTGFGGCGSCSTRSLRDALDLEAVGVPAVCIVHEALVPAVQALARYLGAPGYPVVTVGYPHDPTAHWTKQEAQLVAEQIAPAVRDRLTRR